MPRATIPTPFPGTPPLGLALALLVGAGCIGERPHPLPADRPWIQVSTSRVVFAQTAFMPETLTPRGVDVRLATGGEGEPQGAPFVTIQPEEAKRWLRAQVRLDTSGFVVSVFPTDPMPMEPGTYSGTVEVAWEGAANSPALSVALAVGPHPGIWQPGQPHVLDRIGHTTTALPDGGAIVIGGWNVENRVERLDGRSGTWSELGPLDVGRAAHTATLLENGQVFVAGGLSGALGVFTPTWEIYDPASGTVVDAGFLGAPRLQHAAVRLLDGRVLLVGGIGPDGATRTAEIFDPWTRTSMVTGSLHGDPDVRPIAARLRDGRVLVPTTMDGLASSELFDPSTGEWTPGTPGSRSSRHGAALLTLADGHALLLGGAPLGAAYGSVNEIYHPDTGEWSAMATGLFLPHNAIHDAAVLLPSGRVLVAGGSALGPDTSVVEIFDPATAAWTVAGALSSPRSGHTVTVLTDGRVLAFGGTPSPDRPEFWREPPP